MNIRVYPSLDGAAGERFNVFAARLADPRLTEAEVRALVRHEADWARRSPLLNGQTHAYEAAARLLADLRLLKWTIRADTCGIELESPPHPRLQTRSPEVIRAAKDAVRSELAPALAQQFADPLVRRFICEMEEPRPGSRRKSIRALIADGREVYSRLQPALTLPAVGRGPALAQAIQPYLQLLPGEGESTVLDEFTRIPLHDIWRYFRYTWSIPQTAIPGRQMFYLVRDRAHPNHAVIGIAALGNSPLISPLRDNTIGWTQEAFAARLIAAAKCGDRGELRRLARHLESLVDGAIDEVDPRKLVKPSELAAPTDDTIARLHRLANEFASRRADALREVAEAANASVPLTAQETEQSDFEIPPVSIAMLELEGKRAPKDSAETLARKLLVAKKRAFELARLLRSRRALADHRAQLVDPATTEVMLRDEEFLFAMTTALTAAKSERVGTSVLEITTCGAIAPYNHLLGGKLVALLLLSPEVADDYARRYRDRPAIISSQLKNSERTKDCTLAWLSTTSLYSLGSSQYERLRLPSGIISEEQAEIRFDHIGDTEGYGTVQFSEATVQAVQAALEELHRYKSVNSIFGEGFSPKFRKLRDGMESLGFNPTVLMRHDQQRRMYAVPIWPEADGFLRGEPAKVPDYVRKPGRFRDATARIAEFWRTRWLASRLNHGPAVIAVRDCPTWLLSDRVEGIPMNERSLKSRSKKSAPTSHLPPERAPVVSSRPDADDGLKFWRDLAQAGPEACADELPEEQLDRLHVPQPLDDFLLDHVRRGFSIVLTGNAGDGKTHVLRRLERELRKSRADVEPDATAAMKPDDVSGILRRWREAYRKGRPFCLAANEYPLYLLRRERKTFAPLEEVRRQWEDRLSYARNPQPEEDAREKIILIDLSLRNPLAPGFTGKLLDKLLEQPELKDAAEADPGGDIAWNVRHLAHPTVRKRLLDLCARLAAAGHRTTVRELWIWAARLVVGSGQEDRKPVRSPERWYSSRLFELDERFPLSKMLRGLADPASQSHPVWDDRLENRRVATGWQVETESINGLQLEKASHFDAAKRRFYFEHEAGEEALTLDGVPGNELLSVLRAQQPPDEAFKQSLVESINIAYCPELFPEMKTLLYLWIGHRFQEQPSHGYLANQNIPSAQLELSRPRLPRRLDGVFDYQADHVLLTYRDKRVRLRVDHRLIMAMERLRQGVPRQLLPDRELNRLDAFLEQLRRADVPKARQFFIHSHDERTTVQISLSHDLSCYDSVRTK